MNQDSYLNIHQFFDEMMMIIPESIISTKYIEENREYFHELNYELYEHYANDRLSLNLAAKILEMFFVKTFEHKPLLYNILEDDYGLLEED